MKSGYYIVKDAEGDLVPALYVEHRLASMPHIELKEWILLGQADPIPDDSGKIKPIQFLGEDMEGLVSRERRYFKSSRMN